MTVGAREPADNDRVLWARVTLLATRRLTDYEKVKAFRILNQVRPRWNGARLARELIKFGHQEVYDKLPDDRLALLEEAYLAAKGADETEPERVALMLAALDARLTVLQELGRPTEAVRADLTTLVRTTVAARERERVRLGLTTLADWLDDERRSRAAASVQRLRDDDSLWDRLDLAA